MNELWKYYAKSKKPIIRKQYAAWFHLHKTSRRKYLVVAYGLKSWNEWGKGDGTYQHDIYHISRAGTTFPNLLNICPSHYVVFGVFFFFSFLILFIYFWLCLVFSAAHGFCLAVVSGATLQLCCAGFSLLGLLLLWSTGARHKGFRSCGAEA